MADYQKIHPKAVGAPPPLPLDKQPKRRRSCWCKCLCWSIVTLIIILIAIGAAVAILYLIFKPKIPNYSVDNLRVSDLTLNFDLSLSATFSIRITAYNPNERIGIYYYRKGSHLSAWYRNTNLCQGSIPNFYQGHRNRTVMNVELSGRNEYGRTVLEALQEQQQSGSIPLDLKINVPVRIKVGTMKMKKIKVKGSCKLIVDSLSANSLVRIKSNSCNFGVKL